MIKMSVRLYSLLLSILFSATAFAQLSPPGMGNTKTAFWSAIGVSQKLNENTTSKTYFGSGYISGNKNDNPFNNPSIFVLNEELYHKLNDNWKYSYALSYRRQQEYDENFEIPASAGIKQEFRLYGRLAYTTYLGRTKWTTTFRQEIRKFYDDNFARVPEDLQLRSRLKTQLSVPLGITAESSIMGSAEALFSIANDSNEGWGSPDYKESRFCLYYCYSPDNLPVTFDIGYMNDLIGYGGHITDASYLAVDVIIKNPFSHS